MTAKRFKFICDDEKCFFKDGNKALYCYEVVDLLNSLSDENEQLEEAREYYQENFLTMKTERNQFKRENDLLKFQLDECRNNKLFSRRELEKENEQLKFERDRYKRLSEIRQENINNRILTIKEFIDNCSDKKVKKTLEQLFHSEVNEYDLSKKIRKLEKENEQLKLLIKKVLETTPIEHSLAIDLKNSIKELYK